MRIGVYAIALNEQKFVERWATSARDADCLVVADTGSTDGTVDALTSEGVICHRISIKPFRFDDARNVSLALLPADLDVAICLDMDEVLLPNWRRRLEQHWNGNRMRYPYIWSWTASGKPDLTYYADKISGRHTHRWRHPVHEVLSPTVAEVWCQCDEVLIEHHADNTKSRGQYLNLLELSVREDPADDRNAHYLGREYFFHKRYDDAIAELKRHLALPRAVWLPERAASMRYIAKSYQAKGDLKQAQRWFIEATLEDDTSKEALIDAAAFLLNQNAFHAALHYSERALALPSTGSYMRERYANQEGAYDLAAVAHHHLGNRDRAIGLAKQAVALNPEDLRLQNNLAMMME